MGEQKGGKPQKVLLHIRKQEVKKSIAKTLDLKKLQPSSRRTRAVLGLEAPARAYCSSVANEKSMRKRDLTTALTKLFQR